MRTLRRTRNPERRSELQVVLALDDGEMLEPGDIVMLEEVGACFVLAVHVPEGPHDQLARNERALVLDVEAFALDNEAPDIP